MRTRIDRLTVLDLKIQATEEIRESISRLLESAQATHEDGDYFLRNFVSKSETSAGPFRTTLNSDYRNLKEAFKREVLALQNTEQKTEILKLIDEAKNISGAEFLSLATPDRIEKLLNQRSSDGWRLVSVLPLTFPEWRSTTGTQGFGGANRLLGFDYYWQKD